MMKVNVLQEEKAVVVFNEFDNQLKEWVEKSKSVIFDIEDKKQNKEARSFVANLRKIKKPVIEAHKAAKAESLEYGRRLDGEKNRIISEIDSVIAVYAIPLAELEEKEALRIESIKLRIVEMQNIAYTDITNDSLNSLELKERLTKLKSISIDDTFCEFKGEAAESKLSTISNLERLIEVACESEIKEAELSRLQNEEAERKQIERDNEIREDARIKAEKKAAYELQAEKDDAERRELELRLQAETAEREKLQAIQRVEEEKQQAIIDERERAAQEQREKDNATMQQKQDDEKKASNRAHQKKINNEALKCFEENGIVIGMEVIKLIAQGKIKNVSVNY